MNITFDNGFVFYTYPVSVTEIKLFGFICDGRKITIIIPSMKQKKTKRQIALTLAGDSEENL